ncbi:MAG: hypothetical protein QOF65_1044, partial [Thermoleophilaceae bacterium]|nr:hypothetical protein [Thermoleophilaceae bacterium]
METPASGKYKKGMEATAPRARCAYPIDDEFFDEAFEGEGDPRAHYARLIGELEHTDLRELELAVSGDLHSRGVAFHTAKGDSRFRMDPVPRLFT